MAQSQIDQLRENYGSTQLQDNYGLTQIMEEFIRNIRLSEASFLFQIDSLKSRVNELESYILQYQLAFPTSFVCRVCEMLCFEEAEGSKRLYEKCRNNCGGGICLGCHGAGFAYTCCTN